jgi:hypothetical protein
MSLAFEPGGGGTLQSGRAEIFFEVLGLTVWNFVDRVVVIDAEQVSDGDAFGFEGAKNRVVDQGAAQRADVRAPRRGLRVIDRLLPFDLFQQLVAPKHKETHCSLRRREGQCRRFSASLSLGR